MGKLSLKLSTENVHISQVIPLWISSPPKPQTTSPYLALLKKHLPHINPLSFFRIALNPSCILFWRFISRNKSPFTQFTELSQHFPRLFRMVSHTRLRATIPFHDTASISKRIPRGTLRRKKTVGAINSHPTVKIF